MKRAVYGIGSLHDLGDEIGKVQRSVTLPDGGVLITPGPDDPAPPTGNPPKGGGLVNGDGYPAGVKATAKAWTADQRYRLQSGDTLSGIARTYLGDPSRWKEIWNEQETAVKTGKSPDKLAAGFILDMPEEVKKKARALGVLGMDPKLKKGLIAGAVALGSVGLVAAAVRASRGSR